jgi:processive 1,2-diacylglycerol beta-glucosyltransferase
MPGAAGRTPTRIWDTPAADRRFVISIKYRYNASRIQLIASNKRTICEAPMIRLYDTETGENVGEISEAQLIFMVEQLEEESAEDRDYYINRLTLDMFTDRGADPALVTLLGNALGQRDDMEIRWERV